MRSSSFSSVHEDELWRSVPDAVDDMVCLYSGSVRGGTDVAMTGGYGLGC